MSVVAEFSIPHAEFALAETFTEVPELVLEPERAVAQPPDRTIPYLWAVGTSIAVEQALRADSTTTAVRRCLTAESGSLYEIEWAPSVQAHIEMLLDSDLTVLTLVGRGTGWTLRVRVTEH